MAVFLALDAAASDIVLAFVDLLPELPLTFGLCNCTSCCRRCIATGLLPAAVLFRLVVADLIGLLLNVA